MIFSDREPDLTGAAGAVIGDDDKDGVAEPGPLPRGREELLQGVIGVFHGARAACPGGDVDPPFGVGERPVVACRHDVKEKMPPAAVSGIGLPERLAIQVLVRNAPGVLEGDLAALEVRLVDGPVAVAGEEGVHVVEKAAAPVQERDVIAPLPEHVAQGVEARVVRPLDQRTAGGGRDGEGDGLQAPVRAGPRRKEAGEEQALLRQAVQERGDAFPVPEPGHEFRAEALDGDEDDVEPPLRAAGGNRAREVEALPLVRVFRDGELRQPRQFLVVSPGVERVVVQRIVPEGADQLIGAVGGQFPRIIVHEGIPRGLADEDESGNERRPDPRCYGQPPAEALPDPEQLRKGLSQPEEHGRRRGEDAGQQGNDGVGFVDVAGHLGAVHEVVDGDEIEAGTELVPEEPLGHQHEPEGIEEGEKGRPAEPAEDAAGVNPVGQKQERHGEESAEVDAEDSIVEKTQPEDVQGAGEGGADNSPGPRIQEGPQKGETEKIDPAGKQQRAEPAFGHHEPDSSIVPSRVVGSTAPRKDAAGEVRCPAGRIRE